MDNQNVDLQATAGTAEAEKSEAAAGLGKFKDVEALMQAYTALEAEFTRRSQKLKELEKANKEKISPPAQAGNGVSPSTEAGNLPSTAGGSTPLSEKQKNAVIEEYLSGVCAGRSVPIITGGSVVQAERRSPRSVQEAGELARKFFNKTEE